MLYALVLIFLNLLAFFKDGVNSTYSGVGINICVTSCSVISSLLGILYYFLFLINKKVVNSAKLCAECDTTCYEG